MISMLVEDCFASHKPLARNDNNYFVFARRVKIHEEAISGQIDEWHMDDMEILLGSWRLPRFA
jgi:hypothetical protein